ncbi:DUF4846 domain-containing protein [Melittangium boletus]|uniref:DUF4846 domain-containing protein n=1 Tax=Melittangium boletus TaxID=83453 RepID=UPI0012FD2027|nr:DUF4846 domain-containing protein [Melittangium boletus]
MTIGERKLVITEGDDGTGVIFLCAPKIKDDPGNSGWRIALPWSVWSQPSQALGTAKPPRYSIQVLDVARDAGGRRVALLGQGYIPAQDFHVLSPGGDTAPWFSLDGDTVDTPGRRRRPRIIAHTLRPTRVSLARRLPSCAFLE